MGGKRMCACVGIYPAASDSCDNDDCCDCDRGCDRGEQPRGGRIEFAFVFADGLGPVGAHAPFQGQSAGYVMLRLLSVRAPTSPRHGKNILENVF